MIEEHVKELGIKVIGKELFPIFGELGAQLIREKILGIKANQHPEISEEVPMRPPVLCPGCPHRGAFYVLKKLKLRVCGDIGCYTLGALPPTEAIDTCICMGASITGAHGMEMARGKDFAKGTVATLGDSTFIHSGITGLIDVVYNKGISTLIIMDNSITGMTGHQQNPTTGFTLKGEPTKQIDIEKLCRAVGVDRVRVVDPFNLSEFEQVLIEETKADEPSVIISRRPCALLKGVKYQGALEIDKGKCKKCRMCLKLGCPAIIDHGESIEINETLCVGCELCQKVCNFKAISKAGEING